MYICLLYIHFLFYIYISLLDIHFPFIYTFLFDIHFLLQHNSPDPNFGAGTLHLPHQNLLGRHGHHWQAFWDNQTTPLYTDCLCRECVEFCQALVASWTWPANYCSDEECGDLLVLIPTKINTLFLEFNTVQGKVNTI